jgi:hypothetical protein
MPLNAQLDVRQGIGQVQTETPETLPFTLQGRCTQAVSGEAVRAATMSAETSMATNPVQPNKSLERTRER